VTGQSRAELRERGDRFVRLRLVDGLMRLGVMPSS
jgi:hypothetical protein